MTQLKQDMLAGLEHSCESSRERIVTAPSLPGIERMEASFGGDFFAPHRHDTYAVGVTLQGVQTFFYRGQHEYSLPGCIIVLHPDEVHDGAAGTAAGLRYRMLYIEPARIREALDKPGLPLPFVNQPVVEDVRLRAALLAALSALDDTIGDLQLNDLLSEIALGLTRHSSNRDQSVDGVCYERMARARDFLCDNALRTIRSEELEAVTGLDRFALSRQFRRAFATSPHRFQIMRRLDRARRMMCMGGSLADVAAATGFADQSHLTRHFKKSYGITPGRWSRATETITTSA